MHHLFTTLRFRLILLVFLAVLPALGVILYSGLEQRHLAVNEAQKDLLDQVRYISIYQERVVEEVRQLLSTLSELPMVRRQEGPACSALFARILKKQTMYANISASNLQGIPFASALPQPPRSQLGRSHFEQAIQTRDFSIGEYGIGRASGKPTIHFASPVIDRDVVQGVVSASIDLSYLNALVAKTDLPGGAMFTIIDRDGAILARHPRPELWVGKSKPEAEIVKIVLSKKIGVAEATGIDGVLCLFAFYPLGERDLFVYAGVPLKTIYADAHRTLTRNLLALGGVGLLALISAWILGQFFLIGRTQTLVKTSQQLAGGDLAVRSGLSYHDGEFGQLAQSFDEMAATLQQREESLRESEEKYRSLVEQLPVVIYMISLDEDRRLLYLNPQIEGLLGISPGEFLADADLWKNRVHPDDRLKVLAMLNQIAATSQPGLEEFRVTAASGALLWFRTEAMLVRNQEGQGLFIQGVMLDITDRKLAEKSLAEQFNFLQLLIDTIPSPIFYKDVRGVYLGCNQNLAEFLGRHKEEIIGKTVYDIYPKEQAEKYFQMDQELFHHPGIQVYDFIMGRADGSINNFTFNKATYVDSSGKVAGLIGVMTDITERKLTEEALLESEKRFRDVTENAQEWVWEMDAEGKYTYASPIVEKLLGYKPNELLDKYFYDLFIPEEREELKKMAFAEFAANQPFSEFITRNLHKDGSVVWLSTSGAPIHDKTGKLLGYRGADIDITARKKGEQALEETSRKLQSLLAETEERTRTITLLHEMSDALQTCQVFEEAFTVVAHFAPKFFPQDPGSLYVFRNSRNLLIPVANWGMEPPQNGMFAPEECWAMRSGRVHAVEGPESGLVCGHIPDSYRGCYMCVPMVAQGESLGILHLRLGAGHQIGSENALPADLLKSSQRLAMTFAENISLALANLKLRETLRSQAIRDPLTGLFNRRYMEETLTRELHRVKRLGSSLGVIMMDLDHFKQFNDTFGHNAGDALLSAFGTLIQSQCREEDIPCRFGGEEFLLILPGASLEVTESRAQQLREGIKQLQVYYRGQLLQPCTLSLGVALFPDHGSNGEVLIGAADTALYRAKEEGRDRVVVVHELRGNQKAAPAEAAAQ